MGRIRLRFRNLAIKFCDDDCCLFSGNFFRNNILTISYVPNEVRSRALNARDYSTKVLHDVGHVLVYRELRLDGGLAGMVRVLVLIFYLVDDEGLNPVPVPAASVGGSFDLKQIL